MQIFYTGLTTETSGIRQKMPLIAKFRPILANLVSLTQKHYIKCLFEIFLNVFQK